MLRRIHIKRWRKRDDNGAGSTLSLFHLAVNNGCGCHDSKIALK